MSLREQIEALATREGANYSKADLTVFNEFKSALNRGEIRAAERGANGKWLTNSWVKRGILLGFRMGLIIEMTPPAHRYNFSTRTLIRSKHSHLNNACASCRAGRAFATERTLRRA